MINLEQVKLLETKVSRAIAYIERLTGENAAQRQKETELQTRLESYQQRIDELEVLVMRFKEDQGRIEDSILAALNKLNQFEEAIEKSLSDIHSDRITAASTKTASKPPQAAAEQEAMLVEEIDDNSGNGKICFEIPETENKDDILDPLTDEKEPQEKNGELDIF
jgi:predicted nuclease with TOPRIM domain